ncbi:tRNA wybutosine-synthesizing protein 3 homolog isoform X2 [Centroberyx gerrardi]|uniref:tRNA wybutosine-synthesizing protein 3 homolog isoform X2 n=1 Tax=Centroberyx gerrardi TaxID=166262 RepID=UPI003AAA9CF5
MENAFSQWKKQCLNKLDLSKKGSVDVAIAHVVSLLNGCDSYFTTSSCSGRIILIDGVPESTDVQKQNCVWLFVSHQKCNSDDLMSGLARSSGDAVLKFEPFVLHVQCRRLEDAQLMHSVAVNSGFRNSGLTVSKTGKIITAVRSTHGLEVPLSRQGRLLVEQDYIHFLVQVPPESPISPVCRATTKTTNPRHPQLTGTTKPRSPSQTGHRKGGRGGEEQNKCV